MNHAEELAQRIATLLAQHEGSSIATGPRMLILVEGSGTANADIGSGKLLIQAAYVAEPNIDTHSSHVFVQVCIDQAGHWVTYVERELPSEESVFAELDLTHGQLTVAEPGSSESANASTQTTPLESTRQTVASTRRSSWPEPTTDEPDLATLEEWLLDGSCEATDGCLCDPDGMCPHLHPSWLLRLGLI